MRPQFSDRLREEFRHRRCKNSRYSLRAFARDLETDHSSVSKILRGEREPSEELVDRLAVRLGLGAAERLAYRAASALPSTEQQARWDALRHFAAEAAAILNEPLHHEILRLAGRDDFQTDARWIAARTGSTVDAVNVALQRLLRLRFLSFTGPATWVDVEGAGAWTLAEFRRRAVARVEEMASGYMQPNSMRRPMANPVVHFQIITKNPETHGRFYQELFGWSLDDANPMGYRKIETGSKDGIQGGLWPAPAQAPNFVQLFVQVEDCAAYVDKATALGAKVLIPPTMLPEGQTMAVLLDPEQMSFAVTSGG
ncbi:MAG: VOC family protein [Acidobacteriota bacterium]